MGLFGKKKDEREVVKSKVDKLMKDYAEEKIDGDTYIRKMTKLTTSHKKKN